MIRWQIPPITRYFLPNLPERPEMRNEKDNRTFVLLCFCLVDKTLKAMQSTQNEQPKQII
jgi:hypothetical protein